MVVHRVTPGLAPPNPFGGVLGSLRKKVRGRPLPADRTAQKAGAGLASKWIRLHGCGLPNLRPRPVGSVTLDSSSNILNRRRICSVFWLSSCQTNRVQRPSNTAWLPPVSPLRSSRSWTVSARTSTPSSIRSTPSWNNIPSPSWGVMNQGDTRLWRSGRSLRTHCARSWSDVGARHTLTDGPFPFQMSGDRLQRPTQMGWWSGCFRKRVRGRPLSGLCQNASHQPKDRQAVRPRGRGVAAKHHLSPLDLY